MPVIQKMGSLPILPKIAITFLLVVTPLFYLGLEMNDSGSDIVRQEIVNSLSSRVELFTDMLDGDFDRIIKLLQEYVNDDDLMKLSTSSEIMPDIERTQAVLRLKHQMDLLKRSSDLAINATAFIPMMNRSVDSNTNAIIDFDAEMFRALSQTTNMYGDPFVFWDNRVFISMPYGYLDDGPLFLLAVEISGEKISSKLKQFAQEGSIAVLASSRMEWTSSSPDETNMSKKMLARLESADAKAPQSITIGNTDYLFAGQKSDILNAKLVMFVPIERIEQPLDRYRVWAFVWFGVSVLIIIAFSFGMYRLIHRPLKLLVHSFRKIEHGRFDISIEYPFTDEFGYLYKQLNAMVRELERLIYKVYEQQYRARLAELRHLQSQINPHFLYNTFFILYRMAKQEGNENIVRLTKHLGEYFQFITRDGSEEATLADEVAHAKSYTEIQTIRFSNRISVRFSEVPKEVELLAVPRLILQPIIENAFVHSLEKKAKGGLLEVDFGITKTELLIRIEDNGGIDEEKVAQLQTLLNTQQDVTVTTGMINVHRRLQIKYGGPAGLRISPGDLGGLRIIVVIPLKEVMPHA
ncbi:sensor histidine kinase [Paenibacillus terreus]